MAQVLYEPVIEKYLRCYAHVRDVDKLLHGFDDYAHVLVIPAFRESDSFIENIVDLRAKVSKPSLLIVVINHPDDVGQLDVEQNQLLLSMLKALGRKRWCRHRVMLLEFPPIDILILGPYGLKRHHGVGLARKIGCDAALLLIYRKIVSHPLIYCSDADARLPHDYFERPLTYLQNGHIAAAFIYPFVHRPPPEPRHRRAMELYELRLRAYVDGLRRAGSPYAFHALGSTMAIEAGAYAKVRGFPKISAGEDFYLLNKLRKISEVTSLDQDPIELEPRISDRVPFGTGPALNRILNSGCPDQARIFYPPQLFDELKFFLEHQMKIFNGGGYEMVGSHEQILSAVTSLRGFERAQRNFGSRKTLSDRIRAFHSWFDGFMTLKFIHHLRQGRYEMLCHGEFIRQKNSQMLMRPSPTQWK